MGRGGPPPLSRRRIARAASSPAATCRCAGSNEKQLYNYRYFDAQVDDGLMRWVDGRHAAAAGRRGGHHRGRRDHAQARPPRRGDPAQRVGAADRAADLRRLDRATARSSCRRRSCTRSRCRCATSAIAGCRAVLGREHAGGDAAAHRGAERADRQARCGGAGASHVHRQRGAPAAHAAHRAQPAGRAGAALRVPGRDARGGDAPAASPCTARRGSPTSSCCSRAPSPKRSRAPTARAPTSTSSRSRPRGRGCRPRWRPPSTSASTRAPTMPHAESTRRWWPRRSTTCSTTRSSTARRGARVTVAVRLLPRAHGVVEDTGPGIARGRAQPRGAALLPRRPRERAAAPGSASPSPTRSRSRTPAVRDRRRRRRRRPLRDPSAARLSGGVDG